MRPAGLGGEAGGRLLERGRRHRRRRAEDDFLGRYNEGTDAEADAARAR